MSGNKKSSTSFLLQGSILAVASIISRVIGLVYRIPMQRIIGDVGMSYYGISFEIYSILLLVSSYSLPLAVSKLVSARMAKGQRKNAYRFLRGAFLFALLTGSAAGLVVWFFAGPITRFLQTPLSYFSLKLLAPCLLVVALMGVMRGFFQGLGTMVPSAVSQIIEQIVNAVVSVTAAYVLYQYGSKLGRVLGDSEKYGDAYGAAGGTLGTLSGAVVAFLFIVIIFFLYRILLKRQMKRDRNTKTEGYGEILSLLLLTIVPVLLSTTIYNISAIIDVGIFKKISVAMGYSQLDLDSVWGKYSGKYRLLINVPISIASALAASTVPALSASHAKEDHKRMQTQINAGTRLSMLIAIPCAVGLGVLASPIMELLFNDTTGVSAQMLQLGCISVVFYSLSTLSNGILQGINRMRVPVFNALIALVLHIVLLCLLLYVFDLGIYAVIFATAFYALLMCVLNQLSIRRYAGCTINFISVFLKPLVASAIMGGAIFGIYKLVRILFGNAVSSILAILAGVFIYFIVLLLIRGVSEADLRKLPKGTLLIAFAKKLHLM